MNSFDTFTAEFAPAIDSLIKDFYKEKIREAEYDFMGHMYGDILEYLGRDGKRIRPLLLLSSYLGYARGKKKTFEMMNLAASLELMHAMLLVQDDIIDRSETRRKGPALHVAAEKYRSFTGLATVGHDVALVLGDVLFANALEMVSRADICNRARNRFLKVFSSTYEVTAWGQVMDILYSMPKKFIVRDNVPLSISTLKTAYYTLCYPLLMGHTLAGPEKNDEMEIIKKFAIPLGLAFQIRDDLLGSFGVESETGKTAESDIREGKLTLLVQAVMENLKQKEGRAFMDLLMKDKKRAGDINEIRSVMAVSGALEKTENVLHEYVAESRHHLGALSVTGKIKDVLEGLVRRIEEYSISKP